MRNCSSQLGSDVACRAKPISRSRVVAAECSNSRLPWLPRIAAGMLATGVGIAVSFGPSVEPSHAAQGYSITEQQNREVMEMEDIIKRRTGSPLPSLRAPPTREEGGESPLPVPRAPVANVDKLKAKLQVAGIQLQKLQTKIDSQVAQLKELQADNEAKVAELQGQTETQVAELKGQAEAQVSKLKGQNEAQVAELQGKNAAKVTELKELREEKEALAQQLQKRLAAEAEEVERLKQEKEVLQDQLEQQKIAAKKELEVQKNILENTIVKQQQELVAKQQSLQEKEAKQRAQLEQQLAQVSEQSQAQRLEQELNLQKLQQQIQAQKLELQTAQQQMESSEQQKRELETRQQNLAMEEGEAEDVLSQSEADEKVAAAVAEARANFVSAREDDETFGMANGAGILFGGAMGAFALFQRKEMQTLESELKAQLLIERKNGATQRAKNDLMRPKLAEEQRKAAEIAESIEQERAVVMKLRADLKRAFDTGELVMASTDAKQKETAKAEIAAAKEAMAEAEARAASLQSKLQVLNEERIATADRVVAEAKRAMALGRVTEEEFSKLLLANDELRAAASEAGARALSAQREEEQVKRMMARVREEGAAEKARLETLIAEAEASKSTANGGASVAEMETMLRNALDELEYEREMVDKVSQNANRAADVAKSSQDALEMATKAYEELKAGLESEMDRADKAEQECDLLRSQLEQAEELIRDELQRLQSAAVDAKSAVDSARVNQESYELAVMANEDLLVQLQQEVERADRAEGQLEALKQGVNPSHLVSEDRNELLQLRSQLRQATQENASELAKEREAKENALRKSEMAMSALEAERSRTSSNGSQNGALGAEVEARQAAEAQVRELEAMLRDMGQQLEQKNQSLSMAQSNGGGALSDSERNELEKLAAVNEVLKKQVASETLRVQEAKEWAAARQKELLRYTERLKDEEQKMKMAEKKANECAEAARVAQEKLHDANEQIKELLGRTESSAASSGGMAQGDAAGLQNEMAKALAMNEVLKKQVQAEGARATSAAKELSIAQARVQQQEQMLQMAKDEVANMRQSMNVLKGQVSDLVGRAATARAASASRQVSR